MTGSGREASWVFGRRSLMSVNGREALLDIREWAGGSHGCPEVVGGPSRVVCRLSRMSECGWQALLDVRVWSGGPPGCP